MKLMIIDGNVELVRELAQQPEIKLSVLANRKKLAVLQEARLPIRSYFYYARSKFHWHGLAAVRQAVREVRPDVVHAFRTYPLSNTLLSTMFCSCKPRIVSFRGVTQTPSQIDPGNWVSYLHPRIAAHACASEAVRQGLTSAGIAPTKCFVTYECVRVGAWPRPGRGALQPWNVPDDAFVVGTVATIRPVKGIDLLLQAACLCSDLTDVYWVLIGPVYDRSIARLAEDHRIAARVRLLGKRTDAQALISGADVFVMPSRMEGLSRALLEAMSQGVCPLVSSAGGMKEVVRDGRDGLVFPSGDAQALASAIRRMHADRQLAATYGQSARARIVHHFSPACMKQRCLQIYHHVLTN